MCLCVVNFWCVIFLKGNCNEKDICNSYLRFDHTDRCGGLSEETVG